MFNRKKVKELQAEVYRLHSVNKTIQSVNQERYDKLLKAEKTISLLKRDIGNNTTKTFTMTAKEVASDIIAKYPPRRFCGSGGCGTYYRVPYSYINNILN